MKKIEQPSEEFKAQLNDLMECAPEEVEFCGKKKKIGWITKGTARRFTNVEKKEKDPQKRNVKACALILLNNVWKIRFFYWLYWRWLYYIEDLNESEILKVVVASKKKVQHNQFYLNTILLTEMGDLMMTMTKEEVGLIQAEHRGVQPTP